MRTKLSVDIDRPIAEVFDKTLDDVTAWSLTCVEEETLEETPEVVGSTFRMVTQDKGRKMEFQGKVTQHEPPNSSAVYLTGQHFDIDVLYSFEEKKGGTRVTQDSKIHAKGLTKIMFTLFGWAISRAGCKAQEDELASLKAFCEAD